MSCRSSICSGRLSTAWLVSLIVFSCHTLWSPSGDTRGPSVVFEVVDIPCPGPFRFSYSVDYIYDFCPLPDSDVGLSIFVCAVENTSFHFGLCDRKFVLCLFGQCPCLCTICHSWQHTGVVRLSSQADGKVVFEDIPVFGVYRPACHDFSLYLFVLDIFLEAVVLSQVHVASDISISTLFTFIGMLSTTITFDFAIVILLSSDSSCSICCSSCVVSVHRNMSSAKRRLERNSPSIFTPLFSQCNILNMLSNVAVNGLGDMVSLCLTHLLILIFSLSLCRCTVTELSVYMSFTMSMYTSHIIFLVLTMVSISLGFVLSRRPSRNPRKQHTVT